LDFLNAFGHLEALPTADEQVVHGQVAVLVAAQSSVLTQLMAYKGAGDEIRVVRAHGALRLGRHCMSSCCMPFCHDSDSSDNLMMHCT
jgi:hypothetical protein